MWEGEMCNIGGLLEFTGSLGFFSFANNTSRYINTYQLINGVVTYRFTCLLVKLLSIHPLFLLLTAQNT